MLRLSFCGNLQGDMGFQGRPGPPGPPGLGESGPPVSEIASKSAFEHFDQLRHNIFS